MPVGEGGSDHSDFNTGFLTSRKAKAGIDSIVGDMVLGVISTGKRRGGITKEIALKLRARGLIEQNPPRKRKESE